MRKRVDLEHRASADIRLSRKEGMPQRTTQGLLKEVRCETAGDPPAFQLRSVGDAGYS
jgi:hypothetical protein